MRVWTVSEVKAGTLTQCLGVGRHFDPDPYSIIVREKFKPWHHGPFWPHKNLPTPEPDLIISCGSMSVKHVAALASKCRRRPFTVYLQTPKPDLVHIYDMAFISRHDWTDEKAKQPTFHQMMGVPHQITTEGLLAMRAESRQRFVAGNGRAATILIGGPNNAYIFDSATVDRLIETVQSLAASGWTALVSTSRRSNPAILERLLSQQNERIVVWDRTGENPYRQFLAAADALIVTKDSVTMTCEAVTTGKPAYVFDLAKDKPSQKLEKFEWFHDDMSRTLGLTRPFEGHLDPYDYTPPNEAKRIADRIAAAMAERAIDTGRTPSA